MAELIYKHPTTVKDGDTTYFARVYGRERADGTWEGWIEFRPADKGKPLLRTGQETSQPSRVTTEYWALGLEPIYLDGALVRARERLR